MAKPVYVLNGPNLNVLGKREPAIYGRDTLADVRARTEARAKISGVTVDFRQSNSEGELIGWVQDARVKAAGIIINAGANDLIELAGLDIEGLGTGLNGIRFLAGGSLHVRNSIIRNFRSASDGHGINFAPSGTSKLFLDNVDVKNNGTGTTGGGIIIKPTGVGSATAVIQNSRLNGNVFGIKAEAIGAGAVKVEIHDSSTAQNAFSGMTANGAAGVTEIFAERVVSALNGTTGVQSNGASATVRLSFCDVYGNAIGLQNSASGKILSFANNRIRGNGVGADGAPTGTETVQ